MRVFKRVTAILSAVLMFVAMLVPVSAFALSGNISPGNRVYFYNMSGNGAASSDFIIVESRGHWGLIDTGHRYKNSISDSDGRNYPAYQANGLSSQVKDKYGLAAVQYMVSTLGVNHLDFVIGTHSHSDHIGGVPEIAAYAFKGSDGKAKHLVDNNTVYFYKQYHHVNNEQDDIVMPSAGSWHNQAFAYQANLAMQQQGCVMVDVSNGLFVNGSSQKNNNYVEVTEAINHVNGLSSAVYSEGAFNNYYDDNITFAFGDMTISLYNLFKHRTSIDENVNSIVATILYNNHTLVSLSDINVENRAEQCVSKAIRSRYGTVDVMKAAHHGVTRGSNSKETIDLLQPKTVIATRGIDDVYSSQAPGAYANVLSYAKPKYGTVFYEVGASDRALVVDMTDIKLYSLGGVGSSVRLNGALQCINHMTIANGWSNWDRCWDNSLFQRDIFYFQDESYRTGWIKWQGQWYLLAYADGVMLTGWQWVGNNWYYLIESQEIADDYGAAVVGWKYINGYWYYFDEQNAMRVGWIKTGGYWYYLNYSGAMQTGWQWINGRWYYMNSSGAMQTGWQLIGGKWYYFNSSGRMLTGSQRINGRRYYFNSSGALSK
ncbi:MAG: MBL fold metallo-hydrolase [Eubacterium sp.]|nr:MBL fold metallo-hydrolase [Eubacterium sp.]